MFYGLEITLLGDRNLSLTRNWLTGNGPRPGMVQPGMVPHQEWSNREWSTNGKGNTEVGDTEKGRPGKVCLPRGPSRTLSFLYKHTRFLLSLKMLKS